mmetsp:Transcript_2749/g.10832  ORF Transcript_2749/g.10832 Transcript_2749/m.10832 type:complete len:1386 (-) Transcript_2749:72-4229(-)
MGADEAPAGPALIEDDGTLLLVRTATDHIGLLKFADVLDEQVSPGNEAIRFADMITSEQGKAAFSDPAMRARFAQQSQQKLAVLLDDIQKQVEMTDCLDLNRLPGEVRMARKALVRFALTVQGSLEAAKDKVDALLRIWGPATSSPPSDSVGGERVRKSKWGKDVEDDAPLHEKYKSAFAPKEEVEEKPPSQADREQREEVAREKVQQRKDDEKAGTAAAPDGSDAKPITVKYQGKGENPAPTDNLYVKGLPGTVTEEDIAAIFSQVGTVMSQKLKCADWGAICFVRMANRIEAGKAIEKFHNTVPERFRKGASPSAASESQPSEPSNGKSAPRADARSTEEGMRSLLRLTFVYVDLSQPLGIFFNNDCVAQGIGEGTQAERLRIPVGACVKAVGGKAVTKGTEELVKRIGKAKKKGLPEIELAFSPPPLVATFEERPFGLMAELDDKLGLFIANEAQGQAKAQGVRPGLALISINAAELTGLTLDDCFQCLRAAPLPVKLVFKKVPNSALDESAAAAPSEALILSSDDEGGNGKAPSTTPVKPKETKQLPDAFFVRLDLSQPLGIGFDDDGVADQIRDGMQGAKLGIKKGAQARVVGGRPLVHGTRQLARRVQRAKGKGLKELSIGFTTLPVVTVFTERPFNIAVDRDDQLGLCRIREAMGIAAEKGLKEGLALVSVNSEALQGLSEEEVVKRLREAQLPVRLVFIDMPEGATGPPAASAPPELSESEVELTPAPKPAKTLPAAPQKRPKASPGARSGAVGNPSLESLRCVMVDLSKPLGIFFDDTCTVERLGEGSQSSAWGLPKGAQVRSLGGRPLERNTKRLVKRITKAKKRALPAVVMGISLPNVAVTLKERPFRFSVELDEQLGLFVVQESAGMALAKGVKPGLALTGLNGENLFNMTEAELEEKLQQASLPARFTFLQMPPENEGGLRPDSGPLVSSSEDEVEATPVSRPAAAAQRPAVAPAPVPAAAADKRPRQESPTVDLPGGASQEDGGSSTTSIIYLRIDLSKPLGVGFDDACVAEKIAPGGQGAALGIPKGAAVRFLGGRPLPPNTMELVKRIQKAKQKGFQELVLGLVLPTFEAVFEGRPFGFAVERDDTAEVFAVSFARGAAEKKGVAVGCALISISGENVESLSKADVQTCLKETPLPARMVFRAPTPAGESVPPDSGPLVPESGDEADAQGPGAKRARTQEPARSTQDGLALLQRLSNFRIDLSKPLGVFFDKECRADKIGPGSQAAELGIPPGAQVVRVGGRPLSKQLTERLVKRIGKAKQRGMTSLTLGLAMPRVTASCASRPFPFSTVLDVGRGVFIIKETDGSAADQIKAGMVLTSIGGIEVVGLTEADLSKVLQGTELPVEFGLQSLPCGNQADLAEPELSGSEG